MISLALGLTATGVLSLAIATDYWLFSSEPLDFENMILEGAATLSKDEVDPNVLEDTDGDMPMFNETGPMIFPKAIKLHSGLWRVCVYYEETG